jgi:hypothetical protein
VWNDVMTWPCSHFQALGLFFIFEKHAIKGLLFDLPKSYQIHIVSYPEKPLHICCLSLHWALSNWCDPCENSLYAFMIKICVHTTISPSYASTLEVSIVSSIHSIKVKLCMWCDLSLPKMSLKRRHGLFQKNRERHAQSMMMKKEKW